MLDDIEYTNNIIDYFKAQNIYYIGHSNGGIFSSLLSVYLPNTFKAMVNHKGGLCYDTEMYIDFDKLQDSDRRIPILFLPVKQTFIVLLLNKVINYLQIWSFRLN